VKVKKASTYVSGFCNSTAKGAHDRCGLFPLPNDMTCRCRCHLPSGLEVVAGNFPSGEAVSSQTEATATSSDG